jgi:hypothetical protein
MAGSLASFEALAVAVPNVLLPAADADWRSWAVVACDQYSSEREYWEKVRASVEGKRSTYNLVFPECYLEDADKAERVARIQEAMRDYLSKKVVAEIGPGFILVERHTPFEKEPRKGLMIAVDLEKYQYGKDSKSLIRPTEGTIVERLPPRMQIRRGAPLELPHIMLLIDDPARTVIEPVYAKRDALPKLYDFDLMNDSGRIRGWHVRDDAALGAVAKALESLADPAAFVRKYCSNDVLLFAVGDGNHSLATAKATWEEIKAANPSDPGLAGHPARYALVELVNIYDEGLPFHPIHRVLFKADEEGFLREIAEYQKVEAVDFPSAEEAFAFVDASGHGEHRIGLASAKGAKVLRFASPSHNLAAGTIQEFLDAYLKRHADTGIDYIHGTESTLSLGTQPGNLALYLPPIDKGGFFATVIKDGVMPRKTFSMGEAPEKRFYIEARRITK